MKTITLTEEEEEVDTIRNACIEVISTHDESFMSHEEITAFYTKLSAIINKLAK